MFTIKSSMHVRKMRASSVIDFMLHSTDNVYQSWWPGTHFAMHALNDCPGIGQVVYMDELVGDRRIKMRCVVTELGPDGVTWQFRYIVKLPCRLILRIDDDVDGATITHTIEVGFAGRLGRLLDPLFKVYFSDHFAQMMDEHFTIEFSALPEIIERGAH